MRFVTIKNYENESIAINVGNITSIKMIGPYVAICMCGDIPITTQFTDVTAAVDYVQRAPSVSLAMGAA
tara:strand:+ start:73 stop:279 length:207 start_codon:yes stop_codon:yes gene_type:complete